MRTALLVSVLLVLITAVSVGAHDGWIEPHPALAEVGQPVSLFLLYGNHSNGHRSYRLAGKWDPAYARLVVVDPAGGEHDLTAQLVDLGEDAEGIGPKGIKGFHVAAFTPTDSGLYLAVVKQVRVLEFGGPKFKSTVVAKTAFASLPTPTLAAVRGARGYDRAIGGTDALEIVPITNSLGASTGDTVILEVRFRGQPSPGRLVSVVRRLDGAISAQDFTSDTQGRVSVRAGPADSYLARVSLEDQTQRIEGQFDRSAYEATYVFSIARRP